MASPSLEQTLDTTTALISHIRDTLKNDSTSAPNPPEKLINPLALSSTAASLIKAQTTKLTLLALNKPFSPSSIVQILNTISTSPLPALITAVQLCDLVRFGGFARHELRTKTSRLLQAYENLLAEIPTTAEAQEGGILASKGPNSGDASSLDQKAALVGTGLVWEVCDEIVTFAEQGLSEMAARVMTNYRGLFNDALEEIDEWLEDGKSSENLEIQLHGLDLEDVTSDSESIGSFSSRPSKEMTIVADWTLDILNHITLLYPPLIKRRIKRFPQLDGKTPPDKIPSQYVSILDQLLEAGRSWSEQIDLIAEGLFENDIDTTVTRVDKLVELVELQIKISKTGWNGLEDEFTAWIIQWSKKLSDIKNKGRPTT